MQKTFSSAQHPEAFDLPGVANEPATQHATLGIPLQWRETALLTGLGAVLLFVLTKPAFSAYFISENFVYLGMYREHHESFWRAMWSPCLQIFFRPVLFLFSMPWHFVLPLDPWAFHLRNYGFTVVNLLLLHRVLLRLVPMGWARAAAFFFYTISKVHLTPIGYINVFDVIILSFLLLSTTLCFLRFIATRRTGDYVLALGFSLLSIFSKDYGLVVVAVVAALAAVYGLRPTHWRIDVRWWALRLAPLLLMVVCYLALRLAIVGVPPRNNPNYTPQFSPPLITQKLGVYAAVLNNLTLRDNGDTGAYALEKPLANLIGLPGNVAWVAGALCLLFLALWAWTLKGWRQIGIKLLVPLVWMAVYLGPTLLVRNLNIYYLCEPLAGAALLLGFGLSVGSARQRWLWLAALLFMTLNVGLSNYQLSYHWNTSSRMTGQLRQPVIAELAGQPFDSLTFITNQRELWEFNLILGGPMLQELMRLPDLKVKVLNPAVADAALMRANARNAVFQLDGAVARQTNSAAETTPDESLFLEALHPSSARAGQGFNTQPDGQSAMAIACVNATPATVVVFDETPLPTTYGNPTLMTLFIPAQLYAQPGRHSVYLKDTRGKSNRLEWVVQP